MKVQTDVVEILDEIEALVNGKPEAWPAAYSIFRID
jgi:hypothetical protein